MIAGAQSTTAENRTAHRDRASLNKHLATPNDIAEALIGRSYTSRGRIMRFL